MVYKALDARTREFMLMELEMDVRNGNVYISRRLSEQGAERWVELLREAIINGDDDSLALALSQGDLLRRQEERRTKTGVTMVKVPYTAPFTLAEGEFNRFYARGVCYRALNEGIEEVEVYRARHSDIPRKESEALVGQRLSAESIIDDLRTSQGVDTALGVPAGPNSGLSIRLPDSP